MKRVMIVDDQASMLRLLRLGIEDAGYEVETASNGSECLIKLLDGLPDFLVTDIEMPCMDGKELCLTIKKQIPHRTFPIVVLTSCAEREHRSWTRDMDNLSFMEKPVSIRQLVSLINCALADEELAEES